MRILIGLLTAIFFLVPTANAHDYKLGQLQIAHPWARATPPGATTAGAFLTVTNHGAEPDRLVGASSPAGRIEVHAMDMTDGVMTMRPRPDGLEIPAGATVELAPGGIHLMVTGLAVPFRQDDRIPVILRFEKAGEVAVELAVGPIGAPAPAAGEPAAHPHP